MMNKFKVPVLCIVLLSVVPQSYCQDCAPKLKIFEIKYGNVETVYEIASSFKSHEGRVSFDKKSAKLIVFDCPENIRRISEVIKDIDVREKQVEIKLLVVGTSQKTMESIGVSAESAVLPESEFTAVVELLKKDKNNDFLSNSTLRTLSGIPAVLHTAKKEFIGQEVVVVDNTVVATPIREPTGSSLEILPVVNNDGTVKVILRPSASDLENRQVSYDRTIMTSAIVNDGDTLAVGPKGTGKDSSDKEAVVMFFTVRVVD